VATLIVYANQMGSVASSLNTYAGARTGSGSTKTAYNGQSSNLVGQDNNGSQYICHEGFIEWSGTSALGASATVTAVVFQYWSSSWAVAVAHTQEFRLRDWGGGDADTADWVSGASLPTPIVASITAATTPPGGAGSAYLTATDVAFVANVNKTAATRVLINSSRHRLNNAPGVFSTEGIYYSGSENPAGTGTEAKLTITYTPPSEPHSGTAILKGGGIATIAAKKNALRSQAMTGGGIATLVPRKGAVSAVAATGGGTVAITGVKTIVLAKSGTASLTGGGAITLGRSTARFGSLGTTVGTPESMHPNTAPPTQNSTGDYTIGIGFTPSVNGQITHFRFWDNPSHSGGANHAFSLWTAAGVRLAGPVVAPEVAGNTWHEVALPTPVNVVAGTTYRASYHVPSWGSWSTAYPTSLAPHLTAVGGAWYTAGYDQFPATAQPTNYYPIDVIFVPAGVNNGLTGGGVIAITGVKGTALVTKYGTVAATGGGVVTISPRPARLRVVAMTGGGVITSTRVKGARAALPMTGGGTVALARTTARSRTVSMTGGGAAALQRTTARSYALTAKGGGVVTVSYTTTLAPTKFGTVAATGGGVIIVGARKAALRTLTMTGGGVITSTSAAGRRTQIVATGGGVIVVARVAGRRAGVVATGGGAITLARRTARSGTATATGGGRISYAYAAGSSRSGFVSATGGGVITITGTASWPRLKRSYSVLI